MGGKGHFRKGCERLNQGEVTHQSQAFVTQHDHGDSSRMAQYGELESNVGKTLRLFAMGFTFKDITHQSITGTYLITESAGVYQSGPI
jgi:hypothetical protein